MAAIVKNAALSLRVNELFSRYVAIETEQCRLDGLGTKEAAEEAEALSTPALATMEEVNAIRDRSGNADIIAATILLGLMLTNPWDKIGPGHVWNLGESETELRLLEMVADQTSGAVREQAAKALATIGVEIEPEAPDPIIVAIDAYKAEREAAEAIPHEEKMDAAFDDAYNNRVLPLFFAIEGLAPTTMAGAVLALQFLKEENEGGPSALNDSLITSVVAFLEGRRA